MIDVIIPVRDREYKRINRCISSIHDDDLIKSIVVVDYNSKKPISLPKKFKKATVLRVDGMKVWNKAHAINVGVKGTMSEYLMTLDVDMILSETHLKQISEKISNESFIIDTNVRRIEMKDLSEDYSEMIKKSRTWRTEADVRQLHNTANGGFQVYPRNFYDKIGGINEDMGKYHMAVDNWVFYMARINGLNIFDISYPLLHMEHKVQKTDHYKGDDQRMIENWVVFKSNYLNQMVKKGIKKNPSKIALDTPTTPMFEKFQEEYYKQNEIINKAISEGKTEVEMFGQKFELKRQKPRVLIAVIENSGSLPGYFVWDLFALWQHTVAAGYDVEIQNIVATDVNSMRNFAVKCALGGVAGKRYNYLVQLDTDHRYSSNFLVKFLSLMEQNKWPVLTGLTACRKDGYPNTQYLKADFNGGDYSDPKNVLKANKAIEKIVPIEASGPVGMVINTKVFDKLNWPYYYMSWGQKEVEGKTIDTQKGGDLNFSETLTKKGIPIRCDLATSFPHNEDFFLNRGTVINKRANQW